MKNTIEKQHYRSQIDSLLKTYYTLDGSTQSLTKINQEAVNAMQNPNQDNLLLEGLHLMRLSTQGSYSDVFQAVYNKLCRGINHEETQHPSSLFVFHAGKRLFSELTNPKKNLSTPFCSLLKNKNYIPFFVEEKDPLVNGIIEAASQPHHSNDLKQHSLEAYCRDNKALRVILNKPRILYEKNDTPFKKGLAAGGALLYHLNKELCQATGAWTKIKEFDQALTAQNDSNNPATLKHEIQ